MERRSAAAVAKDKLVMDVVESFMSANIPLEKLDNPKLREFFKNSVKGGGSLPNATTLRQIYVEKVYNQQPNEILKRLADQKIAVIVDETTDMRGRYVVNVLMHPLDSFAPVHFKALLVNTEFLTAINNVSIAQLIVRTLTNMNIEFNNVLALVSDAVYMKKVLQGWPMWNAVHVTAGHTLFTSSEVNFVILLICVSSSGNYEFNFFEDARTSFSIFTPSEMPAFHHPNHIDRYASFVEKKIDD